MIDINSAVTVEKIAGTDFATGLLLKRLVPLVSHVSACKKVLIIKSQIDLDVWMP